MNKLASFAFAFASVTAVSAARGAQVAFSLSSTGPAPTQNTFYLPATPGQAVTVYIWAGRTDTTPGNFVNVLGLDIKAVQRGTTTAIPLAGLSFTWDNPSLAVTDADTGEVEYRYRWDSVVAPTYNASVGGSPMAVFDARAFTTRPAAGTNSPVTTMRKVATMTFTMPATGVDLFIGVSPFWISELAHTQTSTFGFGDAPILSTGAASSNTFSAVADFVHLTEPDYEPDTPEPASIGLLGLGLLALAGGSRRSR